MEIFSPWDLDDRCILSTELRPIYAQPALVTILANKAKLIIPSEVRLCLSPIEIFRGGGGGGGG